MAAAAFRQRRLPAGCGNKVVTPLGRSRWHISGGEHDISLSPSVANNAFPCRSHYFIKAGRIQWASTLSGESQTNTSSYNWTSSATYNPAWGVETSATDENGKVTTATYDALGRRTAVWLPNTPQASNPTPSIAYAYTESLTAPSTVKTTTLIASQQVSTYTLYDGLGQVVQTQTAAEGSGTAIADSYYDTAGRVSATNNTYWTTSVNPSTALFVPASEQQIPSETVTQYDGAGRVTATILNSGLVEKYRTSYSYPGTDRTDTNPPAGGTPTTTITDSKGERTALIQYLAATTDGAATQEKTTYGYDPAGKMTSMVDPVGNTWTWTFDLSGNQIAATDPDTGVSSATFDTAGNQLTTTDTRGITLAYSYDALGRKTAERSGSSTGSLLASWVYDTIAKGQLTSSTSYSGSTPSTPGLAYTSTVTGYDNQYDPAGVTVSIPTGAPAFGGTSYTTSYGYYPDGALGQTTLPAMGGLSSERLRTNYDSHGKIANLSGDATYAIDTWSPIGQLSQYQRSGTTSLYSTYSYDSATGLLSDLKDTTAVGSVYTTQADRAYGRDNAGDVTSIASAGALGADTQCFNYDHLQNLTEAWTPSTSDCSAAPSSTTLGGPAPYWNSYTVDPATGNRTQTIEHPTTGTAQTDTYSYPAAGAPGPHAVSSVTHTQGTNTSTSTYGYDLAGDTTSRPNQTLTYNETGKVGSVTVGSVTQSDVYDANGTLLLQSDGSSGSTLFIGPTELHLAAGASTSTAVRTYTGANGAAIAERSTAVGVTGSTLSWLGTDGQNTAILAVNSSTGAITARFTDPFGSARGVMPTWTSSHAFLNAAVSALSGLIQLGARVYDSTIGKFLSADPVLDPSSPQQNNGYSYAHNNPVTSSDPSGLLVMMRDGDSPTPTKNKSAQGSAPGNGGAGASAGSGGGGHVDHGDTGNGATKTKSQGVKTVSKKAKSGFDWGGFWNAVAVVALIAVVVVVAVALVACVVATAGICGGIAAGAAIAAEGAVDVGTAIATGAAVDTSIAAGTELAADGAAAEAAAGGVAEAATADSASGAAADVASDSATSSGEQGAMLRGTNQRGQLTSRGSWRDKTVQDAWDSAADGTDGSKLCPTCSNPVRVAPKSGVPRDWDVSHNPSWSNRMFPNDITRGGVIDDYNSGVNLECPACNRSGGNNDLRFGGP
ncbi:DUF6527 family protein [Leifsonia sp. NPDC058230]|uniref:DUF6527 family protein n=1 Tax=Leifsonia sp. NPDC058230 TaxID=3346391 RepID=UPI0036DBDDC4